MHSFKEFSVFNLFVVFRRKEWSFNGNNKKIPREKTLGVDPEVGMVKGKKNERW